VVQQPIVRKNYLLARLNSKQVKCLLDTGSVVTLISESFAKKHKIPITPITDPTMAELISANTSSIAVMGIADFSINVSGLSLRVTADTVDGRASDTGGMPPVGSQRCCVGPCR